MRIAWPSCILLILLSAGLAARDRIQVSATLDDSSHTITGSVIITWYAVDSTYSAPHLRLWGNNVCERLGKDSASDCGITIDDRWQVDGTDAVDPMQFTSYQDSATIVVMFKTVVPQTTDRFGYSDGVYSLDGWFPIPAPHRDGKWLVVNYGEEAELVGDFYDFDISFSYDSSLQCIAPGRYRTEQRNGLNTNHFALTPAHDFALMVGKEFKEQTVDTLDTKLSFYFKSNNDAAVDSTIRSVIFTLDWMKQHVGPYPFDELIVIEAPLGMSGGVEFPQMFWQSGFSTGEYARFGRTVAIHETLHQWFYGMLASNQASEPWLDESITEYFAERINEAEMQDQRRNINFFGLTASALSESRMRGFRQLERFPITEPAESYGRSNYFATIYGKGPMILQTVVGLLGEEEQFFWKEYYTRFLYRYPSTSDFVALLNEYPPFKDGMSADELIRLPHALDYQVTDISVRQIPDSNLYRSTVSLTAIHPLCYPVTLRLTYPTEPSFDTLLVLTQGDQTVTFDRPEVLLSAELDPDRIYAIDTDYLNNSCVRGSNGSAFRLFSGITFLVESLISMVWGI